MRVVRILAIILPVVIFTTSNIYAQKKNKYALSLYKSLGYKAAIPKFQEADGLSLEYMQYIATSYRLNSDTPNAEFWYGQVVKESKNAEDLLFYAQALQSNQNYELAKEYYLKYNDEIGGEEKDQRGVLLASSIDRISSFKHTKLEVKNEKLLNTEKLEFSPAYYNNDVVFVSTRSDKKLKSGIRDLWINDNFMALWTAPIKEDGTLESPSIFSEKITTKFHEGPVCFNRAGDKVFFTRNDYKNILRRNNSEGIMKLQIYTSDKEGDDWSKPSSLSINTKEYEEAHPAISPDGNKLYFSSDREGGYGGMDLYVSQFSAGKWSNPVNLGEKINSKGNDVFPYVHADGTLYFASNGWEGLGGLDIYEVKMDGNNQVLGVENIGTPFNSPKDDFSLIMNELKSEGYFTSARDGGLGQDDIYGFKTVEKMTREATICAHELGTEKRLAGVEVSINDSNALSDGSQVLKLVESNVSDEYILKLNTASDNIGSDAIKNFTNDLGILNLEVMPNADYSFVAKKNGYKVASETFNMDSKMLATNEEFCIPMEPTNCLILKGVVKNKDIKKIIPNATVTAVNKCTGEEIKVTTNSSGEFDFACVECDCEYFLKGEKSYFSEGTNIATTVGLECKGGEEVEVLLELTPLDPSKIKETPVTGAPLSIVEVPTFEGNKIVEGAVIELPHIYYDFDKFFIRDDAQNELDKVVALMKRYPTLSIELGSHTDSRGAVSYNENLSQNRANAAVQYIVKEGIPSARLVAKGYGESQLRNKCANFIECPEDEHQYNRRTEIRVLRFSDPNASFKYLENLPIKIDSADPNRKWIWN